MPDQSGGSHGRTKIEFTPIGIIRSPFSEPEGMPNQPSRAAGVQGTVEIFGEYRDGLRDLAGFSHIILLFHFHRSRSFDLTLVPFWDTVPRGVFATRAPRRPNAIGLSVVQLNGIEDGVLHIQNVDVLDGTPLLDIKPYIPEFDAPAGARTGWLDQVATRSSRRQQDGLTGNEAFRRGSDSVSE